MNENTLKKIEQASKLLDEVHQDLKDYMDTLGAEARDDGRLEQQQDAIGAVYRAKQAMPYPIAEIRAIVGQYGTPVEYETVQVEVTIEPRFRDGGYTENTLLEIPAGLTGQAREDAIIDAAASEVVNEQVPWGAQEVEES